MSSLPFNTTSSRYKRFCLTNHDLSSLDIDRILRSDRLDHHIPHSFATMDAANDEDSAPNEPIPNLEQKLNCCCGRPDCAYLERNDAALEGIEKDLETAARLGQALLTRHESYINESQLEHARLTSQVEELELDRNSLQSANEKIVAENRDLLSRLETLNTSLKNSDSQVKSLESLLRDCESEVERLNGLVRRTEELELRVLDMESERVVLARRADDGEDESRTMLKRWRDSERKVRELELEVQKIEWETKKEMEKHKEIVARLDRERKHERELGGAEGRLKGAAALQSVSGGTSNPAVVSNFVRDILSDNANLQAGIVELRDLLHNSNEEVQNLREQILQHQPLENTDPGSQISRSVSLDEQLGWQSPTPQQVQREVHVHHHYHPKLAPKKDRAPIVRRHSRKRTLAGSGAPEPLHQFSSPSTPVWRPQRYMSSPSIPIHVHQPKPTKNRWSVQSGATGSSAMSSLPSSPRSHHERNNSIFDRIEFAEDSSRPTSPESTAGPASPSVGHREWKGLQIHPPPPLDSFHELDEDDVVISTSLTTEPVRDEEAEDTTPTTNHKGGIGDLTPRPSQPLNAPKPMSVNPPDPRPPDPDLKSEAIVEMEVRPSTAESTTHRFAFSQIPEIRPSIRRSSSHDSLLSISGMDIHLAKRPAGSSPFTLLRGNSAHFSLSPSQARKLTTSQPLASVTEYTASGNANGSTTMRDLNVSLQALSGIVKDHPASPVTPRQSGLGRLVGGWVRGKSSLAPMKSTSNLRVDATPPRRSSAGIAGAPMVEPAPPLSPSSTPTSAYKANPLGSLPGGRLPGINQKGAVPGFWLQNAQSQIITQGRIIDEEALREGLAE